MQKIVKACINDVYIYKFYESLINKVKVVTEPTTREAWGIKCFHILDPDNNILEFYSPL